MRGLIFMFVIAGAGIGALTPVHKAAPVAPASASAGHAPDKPVETLLERTGSGHFFAFPQVNGETTRFVVDTGADMVALTEEDARRAHVQFSPLNYQPIARTASGVAVGQEVVIDSIVLDGKRAENVHGAVMKDLDVSLLGQTFLMHMKSVEMHGDTMTLR